MTAPVLPGATLGILGGGQLGRMFVHAAQRLGYHTMVLSDAPDSPAGQVAEQEVVAALDDLEAVASFAQACDALSFEFENVPAVSVQEAARHCPVHPAGTVLRTVQDRLLEKQRLIHCGLPVVPHAPISSTADLDRAWLAVGGEGILKTRRDGYDGRGQVRVRSRPQLRAAFAQLGGAACILESLVEFEAEFSVVGVRGRDGAVALYDPIQNQHRQGILDLSVSPAPMPAEVARLAQDMTRRILEELDYVGALCVEFFELKHGRLLINEIAPRPHNSGHLSIEAHECDQFEQQVRATCGLPLGSTKMRSPGAAMANLLGDLWAEGEPDWAACLTEPGLRLHLYGKQGARPGRKMGHLVSCAADPEQAARQATQARRRLNTEIREDSWTQA